MDYKSCQSMLGSLETQKSSLFYGPQIIFMISYIWLQEKNSYYLVEKK